MTEKTTPQPSTPPTQPRRMSRYVMGWAVLASLSLVYLAVLALHPDLVARHLNGAAETSAIDEREQAMTQAIAEVQAMREQLSQVREEFAALRSEVASQSERDRDIMERLAALEAPPVPPVAAAKPAAQQKQAAATKPPAPAQKKQATAPREKIETGSVAPPASAEVTFGPPVVTPAAATPPDLPAKAFGVQIATGPSVDSLRLSWTLLAERHGTALGALQPRYTMGADEQGVAYNLVAGPVSSPAEAQRLCAELAARATPCAPVTYRGDAL